MVILGSLGCRTITTAFMSGMERQESSPKHLSHTLTHQRLSDWTWPPVCPGGHEIINTTSRCIAKAQDEDKQNRVFILSATREQLIILALFSRALFHQIIATAVFLECGNKLLETARMKHVLILLFSVLPLAIKLLMTNINFSQSVSISSVDSVSANMADISKQCDHFVSGRGGAAAVQPRSSSTNVHSLFRCGDGGDARTSASLHRCRLQLITHRITLAVAKDTYIIYK